MESLTNIQDLLQNPESFTINNDWDVELRLRMKTEIGQKREQLKQQLKDAQTWFDHEFEKLDRQEAFLDGQLEAYLENTGRTSVRAPSGTPILTERTQVIWPDDDDLVEWSAQQGIPVRVTKKPQKQLIRQHIKEGGSRPPGYEEVTTTSLSVRWNRQQKEEPAEATQEEEYGYVGESSPIFQ